MTASDWRPPRPGETGTVGVIDCRVRHIAGEAETLCGRWARSGLWVASGRRLELPVCRRCSARLDT